MPSHLFLVGSFVALLANSVLACADGTGALNIKATLSFDIAPPLLWAYGEAAGVSKTEIEAKKTADTDIVDAITRSLMDQGVDSSGMKLVVTYTPLEVAGLQNGTTCGTVNVPNNYAPYLGVLLYNCSFGNPTMTHSLGSVCVTLPQAIFESQWQGLASLIREKLVAKNVMFKEDITINH